MKSACGRKMTGSLKTGSDITYVDLSNIQIQLQICLNEKD